MALRKIGETEKSRLSYDWFNFFFSRRKRIKLQDSFNIFTRLKQPYFWILSNFLYKTGIRRNGVRKMGHEVAKLLPA